MTVFVTGTGGPAGVSVIRALRSDAVRVVAADSDPLAVGLRLADAAAVVPPCADARFLDVLLEAAREHGATAVISTLAEEMLVLARDADRLWNAGLAHWLPEAAAIEACVDKWTFAKILASHGVAAPATELGSCGLVPGPWVVKPRFGRGSRDVFPADDEADLAWALRRVPDPLVQSRVSGREFTVDALVDQRGNLVGAVPRWRLETKAGISTKGETFVDAEVSEGVRQVLAAVGLCGPANVQGFVDDAGRSWFIEVNPRFSGGLPLSLAAGADLVGEYLRGVLGGRPRRERLTYRTGVVMTRYFQEVFEDGLPNGKEAACRRP